MSPDHPQRRQKRTRKIVGKVNLPGTLCPQCGKRFVPTPGMQNVSCCVAHPPGSCCHYSETEVGVARVEAPSSVTHLPFTGHSNTATVTPYPYLALNDHARPVPRPPTRWTRFRSWLADRCAALARWLRP